MKSKGPIVLYFVVGILGIVAGAANLLQKHYVLGAIYAIFGFIWLLMAMLKSRAETPPAPGALGPAGSALAAEQNPKPSQS